MGESVANVLFILIQSRNQFIDEKNRESYVQHLQFQRHPEGHHLCKSLFIQQKEQALQAYEQLYSPLDRR